MRVLFTLVLLVSLSIYLPAQTVIICLDSKTECDLPIGNVTYHIDPSPPGIPDVLPCQTYPSANALTITAEKDVNHLNGVSTYDLVLIAKHILNIQPLDSPYKLIAADVSNSGSVSAVDLVQIRKLILFQMTEFPNNTSWRFIVDDYVFPDPDNPWGSGPSVCTIPAGTTGTFEKSYIGVKIGDVNKSAYAGDSLITTQSDARNELAFELSDQVFHAGESVSLKISAKDMLDLSGFQFAMNFDPEVLSFDRYIKGTLPYVEDYCFGFESIEDGMINMSWINEGLNAIAETDETLFTLEFTALKAGKLSDLIQLVPSRINPEIYTSELEIFDLGFRFPGNIIAPELKVETNPNPFDEELTLMIDLQESDDITLQIMSTNGQLLKSLNYDLSAGKNRIVLNGDYFSLSGVYIYTIISTSGITSGKLIKK